MTDMTPGRWSHVPANFIQKWEEAQPKNLKVNLFISSRLPQSVFSPTVFWILWIIVSTLRSPIPF